MHFWLFVWLILSPRQWTHITLVLVYESTSSCYPLSLETEYVKIYTSKTEYVEIYIFVIVSLKRILFEPFWWEMDSWTLSMVFLEYLRLLTAPSFTLLTQVVKMVDCFVIKKPIAQSSRPAPDPTDGQDPRMRGGSLKTVNFVRCWKEGRSVDT